MLACRLFTPLLMSELFAAAACRRHDDYGRMPPYAADFRHAATRPLRFHAIRHADCLIAALIDAITPLSPPPMLR